MGSLPTTISSKALMPQVTPSHSPYPKLSMLRRKKCNVLERVVSNRVISNLSHHQIDQSETPTPSASKGITHRAASSLAQ